MKKLILSIDCFLAALFVRGITTEIQKFQYLEDKVIAVAVASLFFFSICLLLNFAIASVWKLIVENSDDKRLRIKYTSRNKEDIQS